MADKTSNYYRAELMADARYLMGKLNRHQLTGQLSQLSTEALEHLVNGWWSELRARTGERKGR